MATQEFIQKGPQTSAPYESDLLLKNFLAFKLPSAEFKTVDADLKAFAERIDSECLQLTQ